MGFSRNARVASKFFFFKKKVLEERLGKIRYGRKRGQTSWLHSPAFFFPAHTAQCQKFGLQQKKNKKQTASPLLFFKYLSLPSQYGFPILLSLIWQIF